MARPTNKKNKKDTNWIGKATAKMKKKGTTGALRRQLGAKPGQSISKSKLKAALKSSNPKVRRRAQFAVNVAKRKPNRRKA